MQFIAIHYTAKAFYVLGISIWGLGDTALMFRLTWIQDERKQQVGLLVDFVTGFFVLCRNNTDCSSDTDPLIGKGCADG